LLIVGNDFVWSQGNHISWTASSFADVKITDNRFRSWGKDAVSAPTSYYGISATDGTLNGSIGLNKFQPTGGVIAHNRNGIGIGNAADVAIVTNEFDDCYIATWLIGATKARLIGNTSNGTTYTYAFVNATASGVAQSSANRWDKIASGPSGAPSFSARGATQTFTGTKTQALFASSEPFDRDGNFASSVFTAPSTDDFEFTVQLNNTTGVTAADVWILSIEQAGSAALTFNSSIYIAANTAVSSPLRCFGAFSLVAGDTVTAYVTRSSGTGNYVTINDGAYNTFSGKRILA
jgi:hypothetical protein